MNQRHVPNVFRPEWDARTDDALFRLKVAAIGRAAGCNDLRADLWEIEPSGLLAPLPARYGREELILVLSGRGRLVGPDEPLALTAGDVAVVSAWFGSSQLENDGSEPLRVLQLGRPPDS